MWPFKKKEEPIHQELRSEAITGQTSQLLGENYPTIWTVEPGESLEFIEPQPPPHPEGEYHGRLVCDGDGGLLADEGEHQGAQVTWDGQNYIFVQEGELLHNERFHQRFVQVGDASLSDPHFHGPTEDDPHYDPTAPRSTYARRDPDNVAATITGHTEAYRDV